jgi:diacylglycerol kinase (ATP)
MTASLEGSRTDAPLQATLVYNPMAGSAAHVTAAELEDALVCAGYLPRTIQLNLDDELDEPLRSPGDVVVAAGGDGTVRTIASRLAGRHCPLAIVPLGTANNIATSLGIGDLTPIDAIAGLKRPHRTSLDVGVADGPWGSTQFLESAGAGLFADLLAAYDPPAGKSVVRAAESLMRVLIGYEGRRYRLCVDGEDLSNDYLLAEVMNTPRIAWRTLLAPLADPCDGRLDLVLVRVDERFGLASYLKSIAGGYLAGHPTVSARRCQRVDLMWDDDAPIHVDEEVHGPDHAARTHSNTVSFTLAAALVDVWLPGPKPGTPTTGGRLAPEDLGSWQRTSA